MGTARLGCFFNWAAIDGLAEPSGGWMRAIRAAGYDGVQLVEPLDFALLEEARSERLRVCGSGRVNEPGDAGRLAVEACAAELESLTLHVGWGIEEDEAAARLIEATIEAASRHCLPLFAETHRATIFQDMWRTVHFTRRFPDLRFNGDFSHWYTGQEMVYGGFETKLAFIRPVIERTRFLHGRIGTPGCMQVDLGTAVNRADLLYVDHFRTLWRDVFAGAIAAGEDITFAAELLGPTIFYARTFSGAEEGDRWQQSLLLTRIARACFAEALASAS